MSLATSDVRDVTTRTPYSPHTPRSNSSPSHGVARRSTALVTTIALAVAAVVFLNGTAETAGSWAGHLSLPPAATSGTISSVADSRHASSASTTLGATSRSPVLAGHNTPRPAARNAPTAAPANFSIPVGNNPSQMAYDPSNSELFTANHGKFNISVINVSTQKLVTTISLPSPAGYFAEPLGAVYDAPLSEVFVTNSSTAPCPYYGCSGITVINAITNGVTAFYLFTTGRNGTSIQPGGAVLDPANGMLYIQNQISSAAVGSVLVWSTTTHALSGNLTLCAIAGCDPFNFVYVPATGDVYANTGNAIYTIDPATEKVSATNVLVSSGGGNACLTGFYGTSGCGLAYDSTNGDLYATSSSYALDCARLYGFNLGTGKVVLNVSTNTDPSAIAVGSTTGYVYFSAWTTASSYCSAGSPGVLQILNASSGKFLQNWTGSYTTTPALYALANAVVAAGPYVCVDGGAGPGWVGCFADLPLNAVAGWQSDHNFAIAHQSFLSPFTVGVLGVGLNNPIAVDLYSLTPAPGVGMAAFEGAVTKHFGVQLGSYAPSNTIYNATVLLLSLGGLPTVLHDIDTAYNDTTAACWVFPADCLNLVSAVSPYVNSTGRITFYAFNEGYGDVTLADLESQLLSGAQSILTDLESPADEIYDVVNETLHLMTAYFDEGFGLLLPASGEFSTGAGIDLFGLTADLEAAKLLGGLLMSEVKVVIDALTLPVEPELLASAVLVQVDVLLDWLGPGSFLTSIADWVTAEIDPAGTAVVPIVENARHQVVLGFNASARATAWSTNHTGFLMSSNGTWDAVFDNLSVIPADSLWLEQNTTAAVNLSYTSTFSSNASYAPAIAYGFLSNRTVVETEAGSNLTNVAAPRNVYSGQLVVSVPTVKWTGAGFKVTVQVTNGTTGRPVAAQVTISNGTANLTSGTAKGGFGNLTVSALLQNAQLLARASSGSNFGGALAFTVPELFTLYVNETGLRSTAHWSVTVAGKTLKFPTATPYLQLPDGTYNWSATNSGTYVPVPASSQVTINGKSAGLTVHYEATAVASFHESGLTARAVWYVNITNAATGQVTYLSSTSAWINATLLVGVHYSYRIQSPHLASSKISPASGKFTLAATGRSTIVTFT